MARLRLKGKIATPMIHRTRTTLIQNMLHAFTKIPAYPYATSFAPTNIALCKYWGKRDEHLNLPITSSLSITLRGQGAYAHLIPTHAPLHHIVINGIVQEHHPIHTQYLLTFLDDFCFTPDTKYQLYLDTDIPVASGLAASACIYAALVLSIDQLFAWQLPTTMLSIFARLGSGSACRSMYPGFVEWQAGADPSGKDSHAIPLSATWPDLRIGLLMIDHQKKSVSSREAMRHTVNTSQLYAAWPKQMHQDLHNIKQAIAIQNFPSLGQIVESNALTMHATMLSACPPIMYTQPPTLASMQLIWSLREQGLPLYFTQDAGPNLKLLFLAQDTASVTQAFPSLKIITPFA